VEQQGDYPTYVSSRFTTAGKINLSADEQKDVYDNVFDLSDVFTLKTFDELKEMLNEHYYCKAEESEPVPTAVSTPSEPEPQLVTADNDTVEDDIDDLLKDL
jgi:hypothetical protein